MAEEKDAINKSIEDLEKEITCAICHNYYTEPKVLPCCHYYCKRCIYSLTLRTGLDMPLSCPECRKLVTLPGGRVDNLPTAFFINRMKEMHSNMERAHGKVEAKCEMCLGGKVNGFCRQCAMFICDECVRQHSIMRVFSGHEVSTLDELKEAGAKDTLAKPSLPMCRSHDEPMKYYCANESCSCLVCRDCIMLDHHEHRTNCKPIATVASETRVELIEHLSPLRKVQENLVKAMEQIQTTEYEVNTQGQSVARDIENSFKELETAIENHKQSMLQEVEARVSKKLDSLSVQKKSFSMSSAVVQSVIDYTEQCVEHSTDVEVMSMHTEIQSRIHSEVEEQCKQDTHLEPVEEADMGVKVSCAEDLKQLLQTKAKVIQHTITPALVSEEFKDAEVNKKSELIVAVTMSNGKPTKKLQAVECQLKRLACGSIIECKVDAMKSDEYRVQYTPMLRGRHELTVTVNGQEVSGSPFPVFVSISPTQLGKPVGIISGLKCPSSVSVLSSGEIVVSEVDGDVLLLSREGKRLRKIKQSTYSLQKPRGVAVDQNDNIYFIDQRVNKIFKSSSKMETVLAIDAGNDDTPGHRAVATVGEEIMACETGNRGVIKVYNSDLKYVDKIAPKSANFGNSYALSSDNHGKLYLADYANKCIQVVNRDGDVLRAIGCDAQGVQKLKNPACVCVSGSNVFVSDWGNHNIAVFTTMGDYITSFGEEGLKEWEFNKPIGLCVDCDGFLLVSDLLNNRIQIF